MHEARRVGAGQSPAKGIPRPPAWLLLGSATLLVAWSLAVPVFEAPDEDAHWKYARYLHQRHSLPVYGPAFVEANSPPLYYALIAPLAVETELPVEAVPPGPPSLARPGAPTGTGAGARAASPRKFARVPGELGHYWPIRAARLVTAMISVGTIWLCTLAGAEATGAGTMGLIVGGLVAFLPQFTFRGMNVSNDALVTMFSAAALYLVVRALRRGFTWGMGGLAALAIAGAILSKTTAIFWPGPLALALISDKAPWRQRLLRIGALNALILILISPWLIRNQHLYGDPLAYRAMFTAVPALIDVKPLWSSYFVTTFPRLLTWSSIGLFGWMNVFLPRWEYVLYASLLGGAGLCCLGGMTRGRIDHRVFCVLLSTVVLNLLIVVYINLTFTQPQGRYLFPALPALALLLVLGLESVHTWSRRLACVTVGVLALANLLILTLRVIPIYW